MTLILHVKNNKLKLDVPKGIYIEIKTAEILTWLKNITKTGATHSDGTDLERLGRTWHASGTQSGYSNI